MIEAEAWVAVAFVLFLGLLVYVGAHRRVIGGIDARQGRIKAELDEAVRLRDEARAVLAEYERKGREAESEAAAIIASAKGEAERLAAEAKAKMEDFVVRRTKMAEAKIPQTVAFRFSLDESFDVGEDTGTPVIEDYADKMPFKFTGKLNKLVIELKPKPGDPPPQKPPFRD